MVFYSITNFFLLDWCQTDVVYEEKICILLEIENNQHQTGLIKLMYSTKSYLAFFCFCLFFK